MAAAGLTTSARELLGRPEIFADGQWRQGSGAAFSAIDPWTEQVLLDVPCSDEGEVQSAIAAARRAFDEGPWPRLDPSERSRIIHRIADIFERHRKGLIDIAIAECGVPVSQAGPTKIDNSIAHMRWFAEKARTGPNAGWDRPLPDLSDNPTDRSLVAKEPIGVVGCLTPYNVQYLTTVWKVIAAMAAGCTAILMPAPRAQLSGLAFARCMAEADLPEGAFNLVLGGPDAGRAITESPDVDMISFTGSDRVGVMVARQSAGTCKRLVLELGGKSPNILLPGADLSVAVKPSLMRFCRNAGQACGATTRTFVARKDYGAYVDASCEILRDLVVGDPWDPATEMGPLIRAEHRELVESYVRRAIEAGGEVVAGGGRPDLPHGFFMNGVLVGGVGNDAEICQEELFGPVGVVIPYDEVDDAIRMANETRYGLNANIWGSFDEAMAVARRIRSGSVTINGGGGQRPDAPFGGYKMSGLGRELGDEGFSAFLETKHINWRN